MLITTSLLTRGASYKLVPWQPVLDKRIGQHITGIMRDAGGIEWSVPNVVTCLSPWGQTGAIR